MDQIDELKMHDMPSEKFLLRLSNFINRKEN